MKNFLSFGVGLSLLAGCGGTVDTSGAGGHGGAGTTTSGTTSSSSSASSSSTSTSSSTSASSSSGTVTCDASSCAAPFVCCVGICVNPDNDIHHCGVCATECDGAAPYCDHGKCGTPPCDSPQLCGPAALCCGAACCQTGELCCDVPGPVAGGPVCTMPTADGTCPKGCPLCVCASPDTPIATPRGEVRIADLRPGDLVYSVDDDAVVVVPVARINRAPVSEHHMVRVALASGRVLEISAPHPTADGRTFGELRPGTLLDGVVVTSVTLVPYAHPFTYDILPASATGAYYAGGALIGSTLPR